MAATMPSQNMRPGSANYAKSKLAEDDSLDMRSTFCSTTMPTLSSFPSLSELPDPLGEGDTFEPQWAFFSTVMPTLSSIPKFSELPDMLEDESMIPLTTKDDVDMEGQPQHFGLRSMPYNFPSFESDEEDIGERLCEVNYSSNYGDWLEESNYGDSMVPLRDDPLMMELPIEEPRTVSKYTLQWAKKGFKCLDGVKKDKIRMSLRPSHILSTPNAESMDDKMCTDLCKPQNMYNSDGFNFTSRTEEKITCDPDNTKAHKVYAGNLSPFAGNSSNGCAAVEAMAGAPGRALRKRRS